LEAVVRFHLSTRRVHRLRRRPAAFWSLTVGLALVTGVTAAAITGRAAADLEAWGTAEVVAVATRDLDAGAVVGPDDVRWEARPLAVVPDDVLVEGSTAVGRVVVAGIRRGEAVVAGRLAPDGLHGLAALLPPDTRAVTIPSGRGRLDVQPGDQVDVWRATGRVTSGASADAGLVARAAVVVARGDDGSVTVAVAPDEAAAVAGAVGDSSVVLALKSR
jgi:pilus assembly protein CpaB